MKKQILSMLTGLLIGTTLFAPQYAADQSIH